MTKTKEALTREEVRAARAEAELAELIKFGPVKG